MTVTPRIKNLMNQRKRMVKKMRVDKSTDLRQKVRTLRKMNKFEEQSSQGARNHFGKQ